MLPYLRQERQYAPGPSGTNSSEPVNWVRSTNVASAPPPDPQVVLPQKLVRRVKDEEEETERKGEITMVMGRNPIVAMLLAETNPVPYRIW